MSIYEFEVKDVKKTYQGQTALDSVSLAIAKGSMNFLLGANGSGKSTLIKCMAGHEYWDAGDILREGLTRKSDRAGFNKGLHFISEDIMPPLASLKDLRSLYQTIYGNWNEDLFQKLVSWGDLQLGQNLTGISRGQRIQGLMALTLASSPEVLLIDEATAVLDPFVRSRLMLEIEKLNKKTKMTVLIATNIATEVTVLKGRLLIMKRGRLVVDRDSERMSEGFIKIRVPTIEVMQGVGFSFIEKNEDGTFSFLGMSSDLQKVSAEYLVDKRAIAMDEIFIFHSDRKDT